LSNLYPRVVKCALCGQESTQQGLASSSSVGQDLDGRPVGMLRDTMQCWVQTCSNPQCGYCSSDITKELPRSRECIKSVDYRNHFTGNMNDLVKRFYCAALVSMWVPDLEGAHVFFCYAAWACDDLKIESNARAFRMLAAQLFPVGREPVYLADLLRRSGNFNQAISACDSFRKQTGLSELSIKLLELEKKLALAKDSGPHSTKEINA
jgi:hypothetical protein